MFLPLGDDNPRRGTPAATWAIILANVAVFALLNMGMSDEALQRWTLAWGFDVEHPVSLQLFTSMFMHAGWIHLLGNMWVLWIVGDNVEDKLGAGRFLVLYLLGGVAAAWTYTAIALVRETSPEALAQLGGRHPPLVGASGAIAAVMGMYLVFFPEARVRVLWFFAVIAIRAKWFFGQMLLVDLLTSLMAGQAASGGVATMAHVGGGLFGILAAVVLKPMVGGGGEGDAWDVHTGFAKRMRPGAEPFQDGRFAGFERPSPDEVDEDALSNAESGIAQLVRAGRVREAIDAYPAYVAMSREQPLPDDVQIEIAHELYRQWLPKEAIPAYLRYLEASPHGEDAAEAKFRLGVLYARGVGRPDEARKWLRASLEEHPSPEIQNAARQLLAEVGER